MSYEGWTQALCTNGHQYSIDLHADEECPVCQSLPSWRHEVDVTNGCADDCSDDKPCYAHDLPLEVKTPAIYDECQTCLHKKLLVQATYKIPEAK